MVVENIAVSYLAFCLADNINRDKIYDLAIEKTIQEAKFLTKDVGGSSSTQQMGDEICNILQNR